MKVLSEEAVKLIDNLPPDKAQALMEYARYLTERSDEEEWERKFSDPRYTSKLQAMAEEAREEYRSGKTKPLDPDKM
jgi:hypothetical protein